MSAHNLSRKRLAPGADPVGYPQQIASSDAAYNNALGPQLSDDQFLQWGQTAQAQNPFSDPSLYHGVPSQAAYQNTAATQSNQIARRPMNQIATRPNANNSNWVAEPPSTTSVVNNAWEDNLEDLEKKAQIAKRDAQSKRKAIPPFVQKLRSFLDNGQNSDLIRWTDDGKSFVVLDEDEFAKKLIPELFKHNNYASFVRQLNMYGFHKKVGLSDNSMRASERKSKSPSEYSNPYFRDGYPDLMWLIQKPKNVTNANQKGKGRSKSDGDNDDNDDGAEEISDITDTRPRPQLTLGEASNSSTTAVQTLQNVQRELAAIRHQQAQISKMIAGIKREHEQLYGQAATFQDQHTRHENSINAILTFLATVYNRSLSGQDAGPNIAGLFGNSLPQTNQNANIVDVGDYSFEPFPNMDNVNSRPHKRQPLLLTDGQTRAQTLSPASNSSPQLRHIRRPPQGAPQSRSPTVRVEEVQDLNDMSPPSNHTHLRPEQQSTQHYGQQQQSQQLRQQQQRQQQQQQQQDVMSMIQSANARNPSPATPAADFANVLNDLENSRGNTPLSSTQRDKVLQLINSSSKQTGDNALINSTPPVGPQNFDRRLESTRADLDRLAKLQAQQDESVEKLTSLLQPLSPSGSIPGIGDGQNLPPPPGLDIDDFLNNTEYFSDLPSDVNPFDFGIDGTNGNTFSWDTGGNSNNNNSNHNNHNDDELFPDVVTNDTNDLFGANTKYGPPPYQNHQNLTIGTDTRSGGGGGGSGGRIESVASSEVGTPQRGSIGTDNGEGGDDNENGNNDYDQEHESAPPRKRRRS